MRDWVAYILLRLFGLLSIWIGKLLVSEREANGKDKRTGAFMTGPYQPAPLAAEDQAIVDELNRISPADTLRILSPFMTTEDNFKKGEW